MESSTLKLRTPEILQDLLPVRGIVISSKIRLELATQDLQCCTLADSVRTNQSQHLSRARHRQSVKLEAICGVSMCDLGFKVRRQIDDVDCTEGAFLHADTTSYAKSFRYKGDFRLRRDLDTELAGPDDGARFLAFLTAFLGGWLALFQKNTPRGSVLIYLRFALEEERKLAYSE
jgi:hypothetical protein